MKEETKDKIRNKRYERKEKLGYINSEETRKKISESNIGREVWNKGKKGLQVAWNKGKKGLYKNPNSPWKKGNVPWNKGIKGVMPTPWNKGIKCPMISEKMRGNKNPSWKGGICYEPYGIEFNNNFKELIRQRDNLICLKCNLFQDDSFKLYNRKLHIHHIDYNKKLTIPENCCSLCVRCNSEVNTNRKSWTKFFQSLLSEKYGYTYSEDNKIKIYIGGING